MVNIPVHLLENHAAIGMKRYGFGLYDPGAFCSAG